MHTYTHHSNAHQPGQAIDVDGDGTADGVLETNGEVWQTIPDFAEPVHAPKPASKPASVPDFVQQRSRHKGHMHAVGLLTLPVMAKDEAGRRVHKSWLKDNLDNPRQFHARVG
jgi:hypothetical protein